MSTATRPRGARPGKTAPVKAAPQQSQLHVPVSAVKLAEEIVEAVDGVLSLGLTVGVMDNDRVPLFDGRPAYYVNLDFDGPDFDDEWCYVDSDQLAFGVAQYLLDIQANAQEVIEKLIAEVPAFAASWKGGAA